MVRAVRPPSPAEDAGGRVTGVAGTAARILAWRVLSTLGVTAVAVITARQLGPAGRGVYVLLLTGAAFALLVCSVGVGVAGRVHLVAREKPVALSAYLGLSIGLIVLEMAVCGVLSMTILPLVKVHLSFGGAVVFALIGGSLLGQYLSSEAMNAFGLTAAAAAADAAGSLIQLVTVIALAAGGASTVNPFAATLIGANGLQIGVALTLLRRNGQDVRPRHDRQEWRRLMRTGLPAIPYGLGQVLAFRLDRYLVASMLTPAAVGVYSVAATAPEGLRVLSVAVSQPMFHRLAAGTAALADFRRTRLGCVGITAALAAATFVAAPFTVHLLFGPRFADAVTPLRVLLLAEIGLTLFTLDGTALAAHGRVADAARSAGAGLAVVTVADLLLIPTYGLAGAAWASVIGYTIMGLVSNLLLRSVGQRDDQRLTAPS